MKPDQMNRDKEPEKFKARVEAVRTVENEGTKVIATAAEVEKADAKEVDVGRVADVEKDKI